MRLFHVLVFLTALVTSTLAFRDLTGHDIWNSLNRAYRRTYGEDSVGFLIPDGDNPQSDSYLSQAPRRASTSELQE